MAKLGLETPPFREHPAMPVPFSEQVFFGAFWAASLGEWRVERRVVIIIICGSTRRFLSGIRRPFTRLTSRLRNMILDVNAPLRIMDFVSWPVEVRSCDIAIQGERAHVLNSLAQMN